MSEEEYALRPCECAACKARATRALTAEESAALDRMKEREPLSIFVAWTRSGPSHRSTTKVSTDHATKDGVTTLCGATVAGSERDVEWNRESSYACKRCIAALKKESTT